MRASTCLLLSGFLLASLTGCTGDIVGGFEDVPDMPEDPPKGSEPPEPDDYEAAPAVPLLSDAAIGQLASAIDGRLGSVPYSHSVRVDNFSSGQTLYTSDANQARIPASNTKLFTTAAAIDLLGPDRGVGLRAYGTGPVEGGVLNGDLVVLGEHDFTASTRMFPGARQPYDSMASELRAAGINSVAGTVRVHGEFVYEGNSVGYLNVASHRNTSAARLGEALNAAGVAHGAISNSGALQAPSGATLLVEHTPIPLIATSGPINVPSHNEFADLLARHIGWRVAGTSSFSGGNAEMLSWLKGVGLASDGVGFGDGSGLSRDNRVSANTVVDLFRYMQSTPSGARWRRSLATAGVRGTIRNRMGGDDTRGRVLGKTGTLNGVISLSGTFSNRYDGHEYVFSILFNNVGSATTARSVSDQIVAAIAQNHVGLAGRLPPPDLSRVRAVGAEGILDISWQDVPGAQGYLVWFSDDGSFWDRSQARFVESTSFVAGELAAASPTFVRVTAVDAQGFESDPSVVLSAKASAELPSVLLVDANDRWRDAPPSTNQPRFHHDFLAALGLAAAGTDFDSCSNEAVALGAVRLQDYDIVVYAFGEESTETTTLDVHEQGLLTDYIDEGGNLILSGSEILWDLVEEGNASDQQFARETLGVDFGGDDAGTHLVASKTVVMSFQDLDTMTVAYPDILIPQANAQSLLSYSEGIGGTAAALMEHGGGGKVITLGFPLEALPSNRDRKALFEQLQEALN